MAVRAGDEGLCPHFGIWHDRSRLPRLQQSKTRSIAKDATGARIQNMNHPIVTHCDAQRAVAVRASFQTQFTIAIAVRKKNKRVAAVGVSDINCPATINRYRLRML